jgi:Protein of unknown function (DUF3995)
MSGRDHFAPVFASSWAARRQDPLRQPGREISLMRGMRCRVFGVVPVPCGGGIRRSCDFRALRDAGFGHRYWSIMGGTGVARGQFTPAASGWSAVGTVTAYAAGFVAFAYALVSLYWALGGHGLISTVGGYVEHFAHRGGVLPVLVALTVAGAKLAGGLLALALVRPWGRVIPRGWLLLGSVCASVLLVVYGGLNVLLGAFVLSGVIHRAGSVDRTALRWHVGVWDLWFLVWGILLALATVGYWRRMVNRSAA